MWVIRIRPECYQVGYWVEINGLNQFEVFDTYEDKFEAMRRCSYLNGGNNG